MVQLQQLALHLRQQQYLVIAFGQSCGADGRAQPRLLCTNGKVYRVFQALHLGIGGQVEHHALHLELADVCAARVANPVVAALGFARFDGRCSNGNTARQADGAWVYRGGRFGYHEGFLIQQHGLAL